MPPVAVQVPPVKHPDSCPYCHPLSRSRRLFRLGTQIIWGLAFGLIVCLQLMALVTFLTHPDWSAIQHIQATVTFCTFTVGVYCAARALERIVDTHG